MGPVTKRRFYYVNEKALFSLVVRNLKEVERDVKIIIDFRLGGTEGTRFPIIVPIHLGSSGTLNIKLEGPPLAGEGLATYRLLHAPPPDEAWGRENDSLQRHSGDAPFSILCSFKVVDKDTFQDERRRALLYWVVGSLIAAAGVAVAVLAAIGKL